MTVCPANCFKGFAIMNAKLVIFVGLKHKVMKRIILTSIISAVMLLAFASCGQHGRRAAAEAQTDSTSITDSMVNKLIEEPEFDIITNKGTMRVKLYSKTPKHRDNFVKLVKER